MTPKTVRSVRRYNVYGDVGRLRSDMQLIAARISSTAAYGLQRVLSGEGWIVRIEECERGSTLSSPGFGRR